MIGFGDALRYSATGLFTVSAIVLAYHGNYAGALSNLWQVDYMFLRSSVLIAVYKSVNIVTPGISDKTSDLLKLLPKLAVATTVSYFYCMPDAEPAARLHEALKVHNHEHSELVAHSIVGFTGMCLSVLAFDYFVMNRVVIDRVTSLFWKPRVSKGKND